MCAITSRLWPVINGRNRDTDFSKKFKCRKCFWKCHIYQHAQETLIHSVNTTIRNTKKKFSMELRWDLSIFDEKKSCFISMQQVPFYGKVMCRPRWFDTPFWVLLLCYNRSKYKPKISNILRDWACQTWSNALNSPDLRDSTTGLCSRVLYSGGREKLWGPPGPAGLPNQPLVGRSICVNVPVRGCWKYRKNAKMSMVVNYEGASSEVL